MVSSTLIIRLYTENLYFLSAATTTENDVTIIHILLCCVSYTLYVHACSVWMFEPKVALLNSWVDQAFLLSLNDA